MRTHYFIDFENVPNVDLGAIVEPTAQVSVLIGKNQKSVNLDFTKQIKRLGDRVELIEVGASGNNALDLTLAVYLGRAVERDPKETFVVVSRDRDFDAMIGHLERAGIKASRQATLVAAPAPSPRKRPATKPVAPQPLPRSVVPDQRRQRHDDMVARLRDPANKNRPVRRSTLVKYVRSTLGLNPAEGEVAVRALESDGVVRCDEQGRIAYPGA